MMFMAYSWVFAQRSLLALLGKPYVVLEIEWIDLNEAKCPTRCTMTLVPGMFIKNMEQCSVLDFSGNYTLRVDCTPLLYQLVYQLTKEVHMQVCLYICLLNG